jgi:signal peptidase
MRSSSAVKLIGGMALAAGAVTLVSSRPLGLRVAEAVEPEQAREEERPALTLVPTFVPEPKAQPARSTLHRVANALGLLLTIAVVVLWALFLRPQSLGGPASYVLVSGRSMLPRYHTGDLVLVERQSSYHVGDVIAYHVPKGDPMAGAQVIHRIVGGDATHGFVVQGDNRTAPDVWRPTAQDIVGAKALRIPNGVLVLQFLRSPLLLGLLAACFVFVRVLTRGSEDELEFPKTASVLT